MARLEVFLLGAPRIEFDGAAVELDTRKAIALLAYLAMSGERHTRDALATLLWPDYDQSRSRAALRRTLSTLRTAVDGYGLDIERESLGLDLSADIATDVHHFRQLLEACQSHDHDAYDTCPACLGTLTEAVAVYRGDFMAGFTLRDSVDFDQWSYMESEALRREFAGALKRIVSCHRLQGQYDQAIQYAGQWLGLDPLHEPAHRELMALYSLSGQRSVALRQYRACVRILEEELGVPPLEETTALYEQILAGELVEAAASLDASRADRGAVDSPAVAGLAAPPRVDLGSWPFVGRTAEQDALLAWYQAIEADGRLAVLEGETGVGKTRLAQVFLDQVTAEGAALICARCYEGESGLAYGPIVEALQPLVAGLAPERLASLSPTWLTETARLLPELGRLSLDLPPAAPLDSPGAQSRFFEGVSQFIVALCQGSVPGILFVDDVHWADEATLDLLTYLARRLAARPLLILLTLRGEQLLPNHRLQQLLLDMQSQGGGLLIALGRLDESAVHELVAAVRSGSDHLARRLYQETEGLPFFLIEYLAMLETGVGLGETTSRDSPAVEGDQASEAWPLPGSARDLLLSRLVRVNETGRQLLHSAAVIGRSFDFDTLREVSGRGEEEIIGALESLIDQGLVIERAATRVRPTAAAELPSPHLIYDFSHEKLRELVYAETSLARRRLLHRRVAETLANAWRREPLGAPGRPSAAQIARHYQQAGVDRQAADYFRRAGDEASALFANADALNHYQSALALGHPDPAGLHEASGDMHTLLGDYASALSSYEAAAALVEPEADGHVLGRLERKLGNVYERRGERELAASLYQRALSKGLEAADRAQLVADWSLSAHHAGDGNQARDLAREALSLAEEAGDELALARAHNILGILATSQDDLQRAYHHLEHSLTLARELADPAIRIAALNNLALAYNAGGDGDRAMELLQEALSLCVELGDRHREAALHNNLADMLHAAGRSEASMDHLKRAVAIYAEIGGEAGGWQPEIWKLTEW